MTHAIDAEDRRADTQQLTRWFDYAHLPEGTVRTTSRRCAQLASDMLDALDDSRELTAGLRKLLEAKDCFVRAAIADLDE